MQEPPPDEITRLRALLDGTAPLPLSIGSHVRERQLELAHQLAGRTAIYLDTRFWIKLRRTAEDDPGEARTLPLLHALREAVGKELAYCPISTSTFCELLKHRDQDVRVRSARFVDELSLGASLVSMDELAAAELEWFFDCVRDEPVDPLAVPMWTSLSYALGTLVPHVEGFSARHLLALQVATFDRIWRTPLEEVAQTLTDPFTSNFVQAAERITADSRSHAHEVSDFETVYRTEVTGAADFHAPYAAEHIVRKARAAGVARPGPTPAEIRQCRNVIGNLLIMNKGRQALRSLHVRASLHAVIRLNKGRRFRANDLHDIEHAVAGVGYCRAMFTEASLATALKQSPLTLNRLYNCRVISDVEEATRFVAALTHDIAS